MFLENNELEKERTGWIEVICGSMFSGKTEELIRRLKRAQFAKQKVEIFKPIVDTRYHEEDVVSHDKNSIPVVGIDEAQFFDAQLPEVCNHLANNGVRVIVAGLDMDYKGNPFGPMPHLLAIAEYVTKVHAVCVKTGKLANFSHRKVQSSKLIHLGEVEEYEPLSREAFVKAMLLDSKKGV